MAHFEFHSPYLLWLLLLLPLLFLLRGRKGRAPALIFSSTSIAKEVSRLHRVKAGNILFFFRIIALTLLLMALARPQLGKGFSEVESSGVDIMLAVDISSSMLALDFSTSNRPVTRIDVSKSVLDYFIRRRRNDRIGLIAFAGNPYLVSPLTLNHDWIEQNMERLQPGLIEDGTAIGSAIAMCVNRMRDLRSKSRLVILLTDGANNSGKISPITAAEAAASFNTKVYTIAIGKEGVVPSYFLDQNGQIAKNPFGEPYIAEATFPVDMEMLDNIAKITNAQAYRAEDLDQLKKIYDDIDQLEKTEVKLQRYSEYVELYPWFVIAGLLLLGTELILANTRLRQVP